MVQYSDFSNSFSTFDYILVVLTLIISIAIGIYHGFRNRNNMDEVEYLMAGKKLSVIPVGISIIGSSYSALSLIGFSTEMYIYGSNFTFIIFNYVLMPYAFNKIVLPIFHPLGITSMYHYLEKRFNRAIRVFASAVFVIVVTLYLPIVLYMPGLCFNQMTGIDVKLTCIALALIVVIYTCLGGYRATVWTDVFQTFVMFGSVLLIFTIGYIRTSSEIGLSGIFRKAYEKDRYEFPTFNPDPTVRISFWSVYIGGICTAAFGFSNQIVVQRCLSLPTLTMARKATWIFGILTLVLFLIGFFGGTLLTAVFSECDPKLAKVIQAKDQMVPLLVVMMTQIIPGLSGLFTGGTFSATLSTFSTLLNCTAALILEDFCKPFYKGRLSERAKAIILRSVVVVFGLLAIPLIVIIEKTNTITQFAMSIESLASGTTVGIFALGIFFPSINGTCALIGGICSMFLVGWISWAANTAIAAGDLTFKTKPLSYDGCEEMFNVTVAPILTAGDAKSDVMFLHRISYFYYPAVGVLTTILMAFIARLFLGGNAPDSVDESLVWRFGKSSRNNSLPKSPSKEVTEEATELLNFREKQPDLGGDQK